MVSYVYFHSIHNCLTQVQQEFYSLTGYADVINVSDEFMHIYVHVCACTYM